MTNIANNQAGLERPQALANAADFGLNAGADFAAKLEAPEEGGLGQVLNSQALPEILDLLAQILELVTDSLDTGNQAGADLLNAGNAGAPAKAEQSIGIGAGQNNIEGVGQIADGQTVQVGGDTITG